MKIGQLDDRVSVQHRNTTRDDYGQVGPGYTLTTTVWADVVYRGSPREKLLEASIYPDTELAITIRHPRGSWTLDRTMRVSYNADEFDVVGWHIIGRNEGVRLFCKNVRK